jgi:hypothetical protein
MSRILFTVEGGRQAVRIAVENLIAELGSPRCRQRPEWKRDERNQP